MKSERNHTSDDFSATIPGFRVLEPAVVETETFSSIDFEIGALFRDVFTAKKFWLRNYYQKLRYFTQQSLKRFHSQKTYYSDLLEMNS